MPAWTDTEARQFEHIEASYLDRGASAKRAATIAGRAVNKERRLRGETPTQRTQGTGNPNTRLETRTRDELVNIARDAHVVGRSAVRKAELVAAIRGARAGAPDR
jgi:plasmid stabilization system protein ParE